MKIVFCTVFKEQISSGAGQVAYEIAESFAERHQVLLVNSGDKTKIQKLKKNLCFFQFKSFGGNELPIPLLNPKNINFLFKSLGSFSPDIIHAHDPNPVSFLMQIWARENNVPFVYTAHVLPTKFAEFGSRRFSEKLGELFSRQTIREYYRNFIGNCDGVIALNESAKRDILKFGYSGKIFLIPNGRNLSLYNRYSFADIGNREKNLIFVGCLSKRKNQEYLLRVMKYLPKNYFLTLVGDDLEPVYANYLREYAKKEGLTNVIFFGRVNHSEIPRLLAKSHLFVSASRIEVQSLVVLEALASGMPVVALKNETTDELIESKVGFCFPKTTSPRLFAKKIEEICQMPKERYKELCRNAREKINRFDWKDVTEETQKVYQFLVTGKKITKVVKKGKKTFSGQANKFIFWVSKLDRRIIKNNLYLLLLVILTSLGYSLAEISKIPKKDLLKIAQKYLRKIQG